MVDTQTILIIWNYHVHTIFENRSTKDVGSTTGSYLHGFAPSYPLPNLKLEEWRKLIHNDNRLQFNFDQSLTPMRGMDVAQPREELQV